MRRHHRIAVGNLVESIDFMDPTRSHERLPSERMRADRHDQRLTTAVTCVVVLVGVLVALSAI